MISKGKGRNEKNGKVDLSEGETRFRPRFRSKSFVELYSLQVSIFSLAREPIDP